MKNKIGILLLIAGFAVLVYFGFIRKNKSADEELAESQETGNVNGEFEKPDVEVHVIDESETNTSSITRSPNQTNGLQRTPNAVVEERPLTEFIPRTRPSSVPLQVLNK